MKIVVNVPTVPSTAQLKDCMISLVESQLCAENIVFLQRVISQTIRANVDETPTCALEEACVGGKRKRSETDQTVDDKKLQEVKS